jgi:hypothetical protein
MIRQILALARFASRTAAYVGVFSQVEEKLIRLALDPAARGGEITSSAVKLRLVLTAEGPR